MSGIHPGEERGPRDWRKVRPGRTQKLSYILESKQFTDVTFRVGGPSNNETLHAHRLVLSMYSAVFEAMFQGPLSASEGQVIEIPDIDPGAFSVLLKFVYTGEFDKDMSTDGALAVLFAARKYDVNDLELVCVSSLKDNISHENAISIFQSADMLSVSDLKDEAYGYITRHFDEISQTEDYVNLTLENLAKLLQDDDTRGLELDLFFGVVRWAEAECLRRRLEPSPGNRRAVADVAIKSLRFPIMPSEDFAIKVVQTGILTPEECTLIFQHMVVSSENKVFLPVLPFGDKKRNCSIYVANFFDGVAQTPYVDISAGWFNKFSVDQPVTVISFGFYGPHSAEFASYQVTIKLEKDTNEEVLGEVNDVTVIAKMKEVFHVKFLKPIPVYPSITYRAWFSVKGPLTCHGSSNKQGHDIMVPVNYTKFNHVKFTYHITGAHQLPEIAFQI